MILNWFLIPLLMILKFTIRISMKPLEYAPTWEELHYRSRQFLYNPRRKQLDTLPLAPDIADTVIDVSDYVDLLGGVSTALFQCSRWVGVVSYCYFPTFLSVLVIRHLKRWYNGNNYCRSGCYRCNKRELKYFSFMMLAQGKRKSSNIFR